MRIPLFSGLIHSLEKLPGKRKVALILVVLSTGVGLLLRLTYKFDGQKGKGLLWGIFITLLVTLVINLWMINKPQK